MEEELGDILLQVVMHSQIAKEEELFSIEDVIDEISKKMIRRHPHVFGMVEVENSEEVLRNWDEIKKVEKEKNDFLEKGNEESAFEAKEDVLENKLKELLAEYKEKKAKHNAEIEAVKQENLAKKTAVLESLKEIVADTDNINKHYNKFQQLQHDFKEIGDIPAENVTQLGKSYQLVTENFYDLLKINKDLRDYDFKKNIEAKEALCVAAVV